jgi:hypothetical protein
MKALAGTDTAADGQDSVTVMPPAGAFVFSVTVPVADNPPATAAGATDTFHSTGATCRVLRITSAPADAVIRTVVNFPTAEVAIRN